MINRKRALIILLTLMLILSTGVFTGRGQAFPTVVRINFQEQGVNVPAGYLEDYGAPYSAQNGLVYGWVLQDGSGTPTSMVGVGRDRNRGIAQRIDTFIHMELATSTLRGWWEIQVPDGTYDVTVSVGDQEDFLNGYDSVHVLRVEGVTAINGFVGNNSNIPDSEHLEQTVRVTVSDGRLTIDDVGGDNTKINYAIITLVSLTPDPPPGGGTPPTTPPDIGFIPGVSIPNIGTVEISAGNPTPIYNLPGGQPVLDENDIPFLLPNDGDNSGSDTHVVTETAIVDGEVWLALFLGSRTYGWVPLSSTNPLTPIDGLDLAQIEASQALVTGDVQPGVFEDGFAIVDTSRLNMRSGDGSQYSIVTILNGGTQLNILGRNDDRSWWYVEANGNIGWVSGDFIIIRGDLTEVPEQDSSGELVAPTFLVYGTSMIYTNPNNLRSNRLCEIAGGTEYPVIGRTSASNWFLIEATCGGPLVGWIAAEQGALRNPSSQVIPLR